MSTSPPLNPSSSPSKSDPPLPPYAQIIPSDSTITAENLFPSLLRPYIDLKRNGERCAQDGLFIAEGTETIKELLKSDIEVLSVICKPALFFEEPVRVMDACDAWIERHDVSSEHATKKIKVDDDNDNDNDSKHKFQVILASVKQLASVAGFSISRGCLAAGVVPKRDYPWLRTYLKQIQSKNHQTPLRIMAVDKLSDTANLGSIFRCCSAFGVHAVVISSNSCDAWYRKCVRISIGHVFRIPSIRTDDLAGTIKLMKDEFDIVSYAAVVDDSSILLNDIKYGELKSSWCCVLGNEGNGVSSEARDACDHKIKIFMDEECDSLNVSIATGILLHGLREREAK